MSKYGDVEFALHLKGQSIVGVDEVGRGALAGPVYAGACILDYEKLQALPASELKFIKDSKQLSHKQRLQSLPIIKKVSHSFSVAYASVSEIERIGITQACFLAMRRSLGKLKFSADMLLIDGKLPLPQYGGVQKCIIGGDGSCYSIAAASILAKEARDSLMVDMAKQFPEYKFDSNAGYATADHLSALKRHNASVIHRKTFSPIKEMSALPLEGLFS